MSPSAPMEVERYELGPLADAAEVTRRELLRIAGGGVAVALLLQDSQPARRGGRGRNQGGPDAPQDLGAWIHVGSDDVVSVFTGKAEVGQNIRTSLTQVVADELHVPMDRVRVIMADTQRTPYDMGTFGSRTTPVMAAQLRRVAAAVRETLIDMAATQSSVARTDLAVRDGRVHHTKSGKSFAFGELTKGQKLVKTVTQPAQVSRPSDWTIAGTSAAKVDGRAFVTGAHKYSVDIQRPGMLFGRILRPPAFGATLKSLDTDAAKKLRGVKVVQAGDAVGVLARTLHAAEQTLNAIHAEWKTVPQPAGQDLFEHLRKHAAKPREGRGGPRRHEQGSVSDALKSAESRIDATYTIAYIAHAPLEPRAAVAEWEGDKLTVWTGTQRPFGVREELARLFNLAPQNVRVIVPDTGAGYGGKHTGDAAIDAARLARVAKKPVKVIWTREEEFTWAYFRPAGVIDIVAGAARDGTLTAWECHNYNSGESGLRTPYTVPHQISEFHPADSPLRQGSYRALAATANHFARESHMDDIAHGLKIDPLELRLKNLKDERLRAVLSAAAKAAGWSARKPGAGVGLAAGSEKGSYVATVAEVAIDSSTGNVGVRRLVTAFECGAILNPEHLKNQVEGAAIMGIGAALFEAIRFDDGKILNPRLSSYRVPRFSDTPNLETVLLDRRDLPSVGAGETPIVTVAPAIGNAVFAATGVRLRALPMAPNGVKSSRW